jgi:prepilin peptidase CpaA
MIHFTRPAVGIEVILLLAVLTASVTDLRWRRIPNWLTVTTVAMGFLFNAILTYPSPGEGLWFAAKGFALAFALNFIMYLLHMTGAGDVKMLAAVGALVGGANFLGVFLIKAMIGGLLALLLAAGKGRLRQVAWNTGYMVGELTRWRAPYLTRGQLDVNNAESIRLPGAIPICLGTCAFLLMAHLWASG